jgi:hypothetical protein
MYNYCTLFGVVKSKGKEEFALRKGLNVEYGDVILSEAV